MPHPKQHKFILPRSRLVLTPASSCAPMEALRESRQQFADFTHTELQQQLHLSINNCWSLRESFSYRSGKDALLQVFEQLRLRSLHSKVAMAAYTCPDIAAAAVRAGFSILPLETAPDALGIDTQDLQSQLEAGDVAAVVLSNLYGVAEEVPRLIAPSGKQETVLIDDACQAALSMRQERRVGAEVNSIGVLSFSRGKALSGIGGGVVLCPEAAQTGLTAEIVQGLGQQTGLAHAAEPQNSALYDHLNTWLQWAFAAPARYRIPASLPWLGLGQTHYCADFESGQMSLLQLYHALTQVKRRDHLQEGYQDKSQRWHQLLSDFPLVLPAKPSDSCIRFPILFESPQLRDRFLENATRRGLGVSGSYPDCLQSYPALRPSIQMRKTPQAQHLASRLVTLPVHSYVSEDIQEKTLLTLKGIFT